MNTNQISQMRSFVAGDILCILGEEGCLGAGGFGVVQCAFLPSIGWVAVKCFSADEGKSAKDEVVQQIKKELSALQQANHENILRVYGWAQWEGSIAIVTELMPGGSLRPLLGNDNVLLQPVLRLRICKEVSDGTAFIHNFSSAKRLTHGDLKPDNILLSSDLHCKVGDFGSARVVKHTGQTTKTTDGSGSKVQVTLVYAAPERLRKMSCRPKKEQDTFSYGIIIHGVLTRETPDQYSASEEKYLDAITRGERPDTEAIDELEESLTTDKEKEIIQVLKSVMVRCWQDKPTDRPDMRDVRDQLHQLMSKQNPSDVMQSVANALHRMSILVPKKTWPRSPLDRFFIDSRRRRLQFDAARQRPESENTGVSIAPAATVAATVDPSLDANRQPLESERPDASIGATETFSFSADTSSAARQPPEIERNDSSHAAAARSASTVDASFGATKQPRRRSKSTDSLTSTAATIASTNHGHHENQNLELSADLSTIASNVDVTSTEQHTCQQSTSSHATQFATMSLSTGTSSSYVMTNRGGLSPKSFERGSPLKYGANQVKPTLDEVFKSSDRSSLPESVKEAPDLLKKYENCLSTGKIEEAKTIGSKIISIVENKINTTGRELLLFVRELLAAKRDLGSIPFYVTSASMYKKQGGWLGGLMMMKSCVGGMWDANANKWLTHDDVTLKRMVKDLVIPHMRDIKDDMEDVTSVDVDAKCWEVIEVLQWIGLSEELVDEVEAAEETHKERLARAEMTFGKEAKKYKIYGEILEHLGDLYEKMSRFDDATSCYKQAIEVYRAATDLLERLKENVIKNCNEKLRAML